MNQDPCVVVSTLLPSPQPSQLMEHLYAYVIGLSLKLQCEGCDKKYTSQRDHSCLMDWEQTVASYFEKEFEKVKVYPIYEARLRKKFDTFKKCKPVKNKVKQLLIQGQSVEFECLMRNVTSTDVYLNMRAHMGKMDSPLVEGWL